MERLLLEVGAAALPDLASPDDDSDESVLVATRLRRRYIIHRIRSLIAEDLGPQLNEKVHDFLDQARLKSDSAFWVELDQEFHTRGVFML